MKVKERLTELRERCGLTQSELAGLLNVSRQTVSKWERGTAAPSGKHLSALSRLYGVPLDELIGGEPQPGEEPPVPEKAEAPPPVDGEAPRKRGRNIAVRIGLAACLILVTVAAVITIWSAAFKEPEETKTIRMEDIKGEEIDLDRVIFDSDATEIVMP